jgi:chromosome segregation ATPase
MQNESRQQSFLPDRSITYSTASSFYGRESAYDFAPPALAQAAPATRNTPSIQFPKPEILLGNYSHSQNGGSPPARKRRKPSLNDPIQTHLLLQTALGDSGDFEILSFEEIEGLKRETQSLRAKISALQKRLAFETKIRDAAKSLVRLHSTPSSASSSPKLNRRGSNIAKESQDKAQAEFAEAEKKCDSLVRELYNLEQRERQVQTKILQHTAGILQTTHHGFSKNAGLPFVHGGRPDSPASLDGNQLRTLNGEMQGYDALMFNDASAYDNMLEGLKTTSHTRQLSSRMSNGTAVQQREMMTYLANGLEDMNKRVAAVLAKTNTRKAQKYEQFPEMLDEAVNISFAQRLDRLTQGLEDIEVEQSILQQETQTRSTGDNQQVAQLRAELQASVQENLALQQEYDKIEDMMSSQLAEINNELYQMLSSTAMKVAKASPEAGPMDSLEYTKAQLANIRTMVQSSSAAVNESRQVDTVLQGLWAFILGAEEELRTRKRAEREQLVAKRSAGTQIDTEDEVSPDEDDGLDQEFSIPTFNTKVQWLVSQSLYLKEKQSSLRQKVKAHRDRADRSIESLAGNEGLREQLDRANNLYATAKEDLRDLEMRTAQLQKSQDEKDGRVRALQDEIVRAEMEARNEARQEAQVEVEVLEQQLRAAQQKANAFEKDLATARQEREAAIKVLEQHLSDAQLKATALEKELATARQDRETEDSARQMQGETSQKNEAELNDLREEVVRLKTELTIAQAELEGAYGSRSQRAAEISAAANTEAKARLDALNATNADLQAQIANLQKGFGDKEGQLRKELADTLKEFEELTKASVDQEREREELEQAMDRYRDKVEALESQIAEDQVKWLGLVAKAEGEASPGSSFSGPGGAGQSMSVVVLKNEFKKMMKEARAESAKQIRVSSNVLQPMC